MLQNKKGYTLVELIIYIGIISILTIGTMTLLANTINMKTSLDANNNFTRQGRLVIETIKQEIRDSYDYEITNSGTSITLDKTEDGSSQTVIYVSNGRLYIDRDASGADELILQSEIKAEELTFEDYTSPKSGKLIHIRMHLRNLDLQKNSYASADFRISTSVNLRNATQL